MHQAKALTAPPVFGQTATHGTVFILSRSLSFQALCPHPYPSPARTSKCYTDLAPAEKNLRVGPCTFGSRLILVSWLHLLSLLLPLHSLTMNAAWLIILNRTPDLSTKVSSFSTSRGKCWHGGRREDREGGRRRRERRAEARTLFQAALAIAQLTLPYRSPLDI